MRSLKLLALLAGQAMFAAMLTAVFGIQVHAQEFRIEDVTSPAGLAAPALKPKSIAFLDRPSDELIDPEAGLIRFEDWAQALPSEKQFCRQLAQCATHTM